VAARIRWEAHHSIPRAGRGPRRRTRAGRAYVCQHTPARKRVRGHRRGVVRWATAARAPFETGVGELEQRAQRTVVAAPRPLSLHTHTNFAACAQARPHARSRAPIPTSARGDHNIPPIPGPREACARVRAAQQAKKWRPCPPGRRRRRRWRRSSPRRPPSACPPLRRACPTEAALAHTVRAPRSCAQPHPAPPPAASPTFPTFQLASRRLPPPRCAPLPALPCSPWAAWPRRRCCPGRRPRRRRLSPSSGEF